MRILEFRIKLYPADYYATRIFYKDILDFKISHEWDREKDKGVMFDVGGTILEFMWPIEENLGDMVTGSGLSLKVEDVDALYNQLDGKVTISHFLRNNSWGDRSFGIIDPNGYKISFFSQIKEYESYL